MFDNEEAVFPELHVLEGVGSQKGRLVGKQEYDIICKYAFSYLYFRRKIWCWGVTVATLHTETQPRPVAMLAMRYGSEEQVSSIVPLCVARRWDQFDDRT